jgi:hypothetical protein
LALDQLFIFVERLRKEAIGEPNWIREKKVFEYAEKSAKVVAVLKLVRAAQGVAAVKLLWERGLFVDLGVVIRCVHDCQSELYFLLETFPKTSSNVDQFVESFFESTIDGFLSGETHSVQSKKIRNAMLRVLEAEQNNQLREGFERIYKTFSGYVHANYAHIMEMYNGETLDFNLTGISDVHPRAIRAEHVELAANAVSHSAAFIAHKIGLKGLFREIVQSWQH